MTETFTVLADGVRVGRYASRGAAEVKARPYMRRGQKVLIVHEKTEGQS